MSHELLPCPFCGGDANAKPHSQHLPGCYFDAMASLKAAPKGDLSMAPEVVRAWNRRATQPAAGEALVFASELISGALEGGDFSGADIQELAVKHGLLREERREEACREEGCACAEYGFPTECYRKTAALAQPAAAHGDEAVQCAIKNLVAVARTIDKEAFAKGTQGDGEVQ